MPNPKFKDLSNEDLIAEITNRKSGKTQTSPQVNSPLAGLMGDMNSGASGAEGIVNAFRTRAGLGALKRDKPPTALEQLIETAKATEAAKTMGNRPLYDILRGTGQGGQPNGFPSGGLPQNQETGFEGMQAPEVDTFSGKPTSRGLQQEMQNKLIEQEATQNLKSKVPTAKQKEDMMNISNAEITINQMEKEAQNLPSGWSGIGANLKNIAFRGEANPDLETYNDARGSNSIGIYKMLTGDNRLSDFDATRALGLTWSSDEGPTVRTKKFARMKKLLKARRALIEKGQYTQTKDGEFITPLALLETEAEQMPDELGQPGMGQAVGKYQVEVIQ